MVCGLGLASPPGPPTATKLVAVMHTPHRQLVRLTRFDLNIIIILKRKSAEKMANNIEVTFSILKPIHFMSRVSTCFSSRWLRPRVL